MEPIRVDANDAVPPSRQIVEAVMDRIASGQTGPGERLPSVRELAVAAMVNPNTVGKAYRDLGFLGVVASRSGSGVFVTDDAPEIARRERRGATLDAFRRAASLALRAGHEADALLAELEALSGGIRAALTGEERR